MSQPPTYTPTTSFADDESNQASGRSTVRTAALDIELANVSDSVNALITNLALLQRDDGKVRDLLLEPYMLGEAVRAMLTTAGVTLRGAWAPNTQYALKDLVQRNGVALICQTPHNSGPAFNLGFWLAISGDGQAQLYAEQAGVSASAAATSAAAAATSATTASTAATNAGNSAAAAAASQLAAQNSADSIAGLSPVNLNAFMLDLLGNVNAAGVRGDIDAASATDLASTASATKGAGMLGFGVANAYPAGTLGYRARNWVELEDFFQIGEANWSGAALRACVWCFQNGATLRLRPKVYAGASIEVHGTFSVEGNGATVDFLGVGNTYIAGTGSGTSAVPTAWPGDSGGDPSTLYTVQSWNIASPVAIGDDSITFASTTGMVVGSTIFLAGNPSTASSPGNYIPANFEFAQILSIVGNVVTLNGKARNTYTTAGAAFYSPGLARNGKVSNLRVKSTSPTPYQAVVRSAVNYELENIEFAGRDALGAATFVEGFKLKNARATGCGGNWSFARGTVSAELDGLTFQYRSTLSSETSCVFVEESLYDVSIRNVRGFGASFSVRVLDMASTNIKRSITIYDSTFDTTNSPGGATAPFQCGTAAGVDIEAYGSTFVGAAVTPNSSIYPGVTGTAMGWVTSNQTTDRIKFTACHFKASTTGAVFKKGSGALGQVVFDEACTFETIDAPIREYTPMGAWLDMSGLFAGGVTVPAGSTARWRYTPWDVTVSARIQLNGLATGSTFFNFPSGLRPQVEKRFVCATDATDRIGIVRVLPGGALIYVGSTASPPTYLDLQFTFPIDS